MCGISAGEFGEDTSNPEFILQESMQEHIKTVCNFLSIPPPVYKLHEVKLIGAVQYRRYYATLSTSADGVPCVCMGRFGKDDYDAQEDVAARLLQRLMQVCGRKIRDFNYYNVEMLESQLRKTIDEKFELSMEIGMLSKELALMKMNSTDAPGLNGSSSQ